MSLSAADIVLLMEGAAKCGVLSFKTGDTEFTLKGFVPPSAPPSAAEAIEKAIEDSRNWVASAPPPYIGEL